MKWALALGMMTMGMGLQAQAPPPYEQVMAHKQRMFGRILDLNETEMKKFWPLYEQMDGELRKLAAERKKITIDIRENMRSKGPEAQLEKLLDRYVAIEKERAEIKQRYYQKFKEVLPIRKVARIPLAERRFRKRMLERIKHGKDGAPPKAPPRHPPR